MEVAKGQSSLKTNSEIDLNCIKRPLLVRVEIESESEDEQESATDFLSADHVINEEMAIGCCPTMLQKTIHNDSNCTKDMQNHLQPVVLLERLKLTKVVPVQKGKENHLEKEPSAPVVRRPSLKLTARNSKTCADTVSTAGPITRIIREFKPRSRLKRSMRNVINSSGQKENTDSTSDLDDEKQLKYLKINNQAKSTIEDEPLRKKPKLHEKTNRGDSRKGRTKQISTQDETTVSDADILPHKKPRLQTQEETTDRQENTNNDTEVEITSNVDSKIHASAYIGTKQKQKITRFTKISRPSNKSKTHSKIQVNEKNVNRVTSYNIFTCNYCGERFKRKPELIQHIESHEQMKRKVYLKCKECTYQTVIQETLERHKNLHDKSRHYVCDVCGYRFKCKVKLKAHWFWVHSSKRTHECGICDYRTNNISH